MKKIVASFLISILMPLAAMAGWIDMNIGTNTIYSVQVLPGNQIGFATTLNGYYYTTDYGANWQFTQVGNPNTTYKSVFFINSDLGFIVGSSGKIYKTINGGASWSNISPNNFNSYECIKFYNNTHGIIVGTSGTIFHTTDAGNSWQNSVSPTSQWLKSVAYSTDSKIFIVGNSGILLKSTNSGNTWTSINSGTTDNLNSIHFPSQNVAYTCGWNGTILKTTDGGDTWSALPKFTNATLKSIFFTSDLTGIAVGDNGTVISTTDGGNTWKSLNSGETDNLTSVFFSSATNGFIVGENGAAIKTEDNGLNSEMQLTLTSHNDGSTITSDAISNISWSGINMANQNIDLFYSTDNGTSWIKIATTDFNDSPYAWDVPDLASNQMRIKIQHPKHVGLKDVSDNAFEVTTNKINITSPVAGERFQIGKPLTITWNSYDISNMNLEYTVDGITWTSIASNIPANSGIYIWNSPSEISGNYKIRATDASNALNKYVTEDFVITNLTIQNPANGMSLNPNFPQPVSWSSNLIENVRIEYSTDSTNWMLAGTTAASNASFIWSTPNNTMIVWLRLSDASYPNINDINKYVVSSTPIISVTAPNGANSYKFGSNINISWVSASVQNVMIEASYDNGQTWTTIVNAISASVSNYNWMPTQLSANALIRVTDVANTSRYDISDNPFKIADITILSPGAGQDVQAESTISLNWSAANVENVKIEYSLDNWSTSQEIVNQISATTGTYAWQLPDVNTSNARVRIADTDNPAITKEVVFNIKQSLNLSLLAPIGNELLKSGNQFPITWNSKNISALKLEYSTDSATSWHLIADNVNADSSPYYWTVPDLSSQKCLVRISQTTDPSVYAISANKFAISNAKLTLLSPNGAELWYAGDEKEIVWNSKGIINVGLSYQIHPDSNWVVISNSVAAEPTMKFNWTIPTIPSNFVKIKIFDTQNPQIFDISDAVFTVAGVRLLSLNDGEKLIFREMTEISWEAVEVNDIQLSYSTDNGSNWQIIENSFNADLKHYNWDAPYPPSDSCLFRIRDNNNSKLSDISDRLFSINGLLLSSDLKGKELLVGTEYDIEWLSQDVENIQIDYSTNNGNNWLTVISYTESDGKFKWLVPNTPTDFGKMRIINKDDVGVYDINIGNFKIVGTGINLLSPNGEENWEIGTEQIISWSSVNVDFINIDISYNNGVTPVRIASNVSADLKEFRWIVSGSPSTECQIRITDSDNSNLSTVSAKNFTITGGLFPPPQHWSYTSHTGKNAVIILPKSINPLISERPFNNGDALAVFYTDLAGNEKSAGYGIWDGGNLSVTVWGDNDQTGAKDGFATEETYSLRLWDAQLGKETRAKVSYSSGNSFFSDNGISIIGTLNAHEKIRIVLEPGIWSMISSYLLPANTNIDSIMQDVESLELMKDEVGDIFYPEQQINTITNWEVTDGYQIYVNSKDTLEIEGTPVNPNSYPIAMQASKWYIISYLFDSPSPITTALSRIDSSIVLVKNDDGQIWYPAYGINQIGNMRPTEGYKIVLNENNTLIYNTAPLFGKIANNEIAINEYYETDFKQTGSNCSVILKLIDFDYADEFAVKTKSGDIVGTGINTTGTVALTVWGDNTYTEVKDGLAANEEISLYVWSKKENKEYPILIKEYKDLLSNQSYSETLRFVSDGIFEVVLTKDNISSVSELDSQLEIYPNPAQDYINITNHNYETYSILDLLGNKIQSGTLEGKNIPIRSIPAGTYLLRLEAKLNSSLHNFTIIR